MTAAALSPAVRPTLPGWTLVTDLTPPELLERRRLRVLRRLVTIALAVVAVLCAAVYVLAMLRHSAAESELQSEQQRTLELQHQANQYAGITRIQTIVKGIDGNLAKAMAGDVHTTALLTSLNQAAPQSVALTKFSLTLFPADGTQPAAQSQDQTVNLSGHPLVGTVTMSGTAGSLVDAASYVERITALPGVVGVIPTSSQSEAGRVQFNVKFALNDQLLSHRYAPAPKQAGK